jgi:hypothetical protein
MRRVKTSKGYSLYELTERDLGSLVNHDYQVGNILIYRPYEKARIGRELGRASDFEAAERFLADRSASSLIFPLEEPPPAEHTAERHITTEQAIEDQPTPGNSPAHTPTTEQLVTSALTTDYAQALRDKDQALSEMKAHYEALVATEAQASDEIIRHLSAALESLKQDAAEKDTRITQLSLAMLQGDLQREELMNELIEATAQPPALEAIEELDELRAHAASAQIELKVLKAAYADLEGTNLVLLAEKSTLEIELAAALRRIGSSMQAAHNEGAGAQVGGAASSFTQSSDSDKELVLADASGSTIHIYHEFPALPKRSLRHRILTQSRYISLVAVAIIAVAYIAYLNSVLGAIQSDGIDIQTYSETVIGRLRALVGL